MPRTLRLEFEGGIYHVINRGNYRCMIFAGEKTKAAFLRCLGELCVRTGWTVHAWSRRPDARLARKLQLTPNPKT